MQSQSPVGRKIIQDVKKRSLNETRTQESRNTIQPLRRHTHLLVNSSEPCHVQHNLEPQYYQWRILFTEATYAVG
jgi:hypothetical protein